MTNLTKQRENTSDGVDVEKLDTPLVKIPHNTSLENSQSLISNHLVQNPGIPLVGIYPREMKTYILTKAHR